MLDLSWIRKVLYNACDIKIDRWEFVHWHPTKFKTVNTQKAADRISDVIYLITSVPYADTTGLIVSYKRGSPDIGQMLFDKMTKRNVGRKGMFVNTITSMYLAKVNDELHLLCDIKYLPEVSNIADYVIVGIGVMKAFSSICGVQVGSVVITSVDKADVSAKILSHSPGDSKYFNVKLDEDGRSYLTLEQFESSNFIITIL
jgi:hypothetical protein